jgi:hypothetical protein
MVLTGIIFGSLDSNPDDAFTALYPQYRNGMEMTAMS